MTLITIARAIPSALLIAASAGMGALYAWTTGAEHGAIMVGLAVTMAIGLELAKPFAIEGALVAFRQWSLARGLILLVLGAVAIAYSLSAELSLMATIRGDTAAGRYAQSAAMTDARGRAERAAGELAKLAPTRTAGELQAAVADLMRSTG